jgi:hypothetical protein
VIAHLAYIPLTFAALAASLILGYGLFSRIGEPEAAAWCKEVFRAGSKLIACICTGDGRHTFSAQCGARAMNSVAWSIAEEAIDSLLGGGHCANAAKKEGLL